MYIRASVRACVCVCLSIYLSSMYLISIYLSICLSVCLSVFLSACLPARPPAKNMLQQEHQQQAQTPKTKKGRQADKAERQGQQMCPLQQPIFLSYKTKHGRLARPLSSLPKISMGLPQLGEDGIASSIRPFEGVHENTKLVKLTRHFQLVEKRKEIHWYFQKYFDRSTFTFSFFSFLLKMINLGQLLKANNIFYVFLLTSLQGFFLFLSKLSIIDPL